ncbi:hypothetical protein MNBD_PLANCTO02-2661 [hydrothermal vent metagenome]|uniref:PDZ domain-containing protein n=1 Tax=hydrothermal vent metagenome TaxID=652676 RepID=A0A3B1D4T1_9ZZZZ
MQTSNRTDVVQKVAFLHIVVWFLLLMLTNITSTSAQEISARSVAMAMEKNLVSTIKKGEVSVVSIARLRVVSRKQQKNIANPFGLDLRKQDIRGRSTNPESPDFIPNDFGTGVIIAPLGTPLILTNYHVVKGGPIAGEKIGVSKYSLYVRLANHRGFYASILAADPRSDLAVLKIDFKQLDIKPRDIKPLTITQSNKFRKGTFVIALGNPYAIGQDGSASASWGMISNIARRPAPAGSPNDAETRKKETIHHYGTLLQVDTRLNLGTSGGALLNLKGELIGITTSLAALEGYEKSAGYAIPLNAATRRAIDSLAKGHEVEYGFLGITPWDFLPSEMRNLSLRYKQASAAVVGDVFPKSPAEKGGLRRGDVVLSVNDQVVLGRSKLMLKIGELGPEAKVKLKVWREQKRRELTLSIELGKWPVQNEEDVIATVARYPAWRGITVDYSTGRQKYLKYPFRFKQAVAVKSIEKKRASTTLLQEGDLITHVNKMPVRTPAQFLKAVQHATGVVRLQVDREQRFVIITP